MREDEHTRELRRPGDPVIDDNQRQDLRIIFLALKEKGYSPVRQMAHYLLSGEPAYITTHRGARSLIGRLEREIILEEMVRHYLESGLPGEPG